MLRSVGDWPPSGIREFMICTEEFSEMLFKKTFTLVGKFRILSKNVVHFSFRRTGRH